MIPATTNVECQFEGDRGDGTKYRYTSNPVIAWDDDGTPLVLGDGALVSAERYRNFIGLVEADAPVVAALPGGEWRAEFKDDDGTIHSTPLLSWNVRADGTATPIVAGSDGDVYDPCEVSNFSRLYIPEWENE